MTRKLRKLETSGADKIEFHGLAYNSNDCKFENGITCRLIKTKSFLFNVLVV